MGYESKLYIVEKFETSKLHVNGKNMIYGSVVATFDLCKAYDVSEAMRQYDDTEIIIFSEDGNTEIYEDCYGERLKEIPLKDAISIIEKAAEKDDYNYRRFAPCLGLLKGFNEADWDSIVVLHYGH